MIYNELLEMVFLPAADQVLCTDFIGTIKKLKKYDSESLLVLKRDQKEKLSNLLIHAINNVKFYKNMFAHNGGDVFITDFPVMHKRDIKENFDDLVADNYRHCRLQSVKSSGSSGIQGEVLMTRGESISAIAAQTHLWGWAGFRPGDSMVQLGMATERTAFKKAKDTVFRTKYIKAYEIDKEKTIELFAKLRRNPVCFFGGYASGLYSYACLAEECGVTDIKFKSIISWGDKMFPHYRDKLEKIFNSKVTDTYGSTEGFVIAGQCNYGTYHQLMPQVFFELLDDNYQTVKPGELGHVVVTRLDSFSMPLIRYYLGDLAIESADTSVCECGRHYPKIDKIIGRDTDVVHTKGGKLLIVHFFTAIFSKIDQIKQFKVVQKQLDSIEIEVIHNLNELEWSELSTKLKLEINIRANEDIDIKFIKKDFITATSSGKPQIIQSMISHTLNINK